MIEVESARFPTGQSIALCVNVMYEKWAQGTWPLAGPMGNPMHSSVVDRQAQSWSDYGYRTGIWHIREQLADAGVLATVFANGILTEVAPDSLVALRDDGHEIAAHAWSQDQLLATLALDDERAMVVRCRNGLAELLGRTPEGWISPRCTPSGSTPLLLAETGFSWWGDVFDVDHPYLLETEAGTIVAYPFQMELNDLPHRIRYGRSYQDFIGAWHEELAAARRSNVPVCIDLTVHAHISGRRSGIDMLRTILDEVKESSDVWVATKSQVLTSYGLMKESFREGSEIVDNGAT